MYRYKSISFLFIFLFSFSLTSSAQELLGEFKRQELEQNAYKKWFEKRYDKYDLDREILEEINIPEGDFNILIFMGTWDKDSRREVPRFLKIVDSLHLDPSDVILYGLDKQFSSISKKEDSWDIEFLPTIIFLLEGHELGRINERPYYSLEDDFSYYTDIANEDTIDLDLISNDTESEIYKVVDQMPRFPGCENIGGSNREMEDCAKVKMLEYIYRNLKYPVIARTSGVEGMVVVQFVVDENGWVTNPNIVREIGSGCGDAALDVVKSMNDLEERWLPGVVKGKRVKVLYTLPVKFKLEG
jgi:TonB family protein